jgi:hypothetical protein
MLFEQVMENEAKTIYEMKKLNKTLVDGNYSRISYDGSNTTFVITSNTLTLTYTDTGETISYTDPYPNEEVQPNSNLLKKQIVAVVPTANTYNGI